MTIKSLKTDSAHHTPEQENFQKRYQFRELILSTGLAKIPTVDEYGFIFQRGYFFTELGSKLHPDITQSDITQSIIDEILNRGVYKKKAKDIDRFLYNLGQVITNLGESAYYLEMPLINRQEFFNTELGELESESSIHSANGTLVFSLPSEKSLVALMVFSEDQSTAQLIVAVLDEEFIDNEVLPYNDSVGEWMASGINFSGVEQSFVDSPGILTHSFINFDSGYKA